MKSEHDANVIKRAIINLKIHKYTKLILIYLIYI